MGEVEKSFRFSRGKFIIIQIFLIFLPIRVCSIRLVIIRAVSLVSLSLRINKEIRWGLLQLAGIQLRLLTSLLLLLLVISFFHPRREKTYFGILTLIGLFLLISFRSINILSFYIFFERAVLPVFLLILGWGYQPERLRASLYILFYTLVTSLPLLVMIIIITRLYSANYDMLSFLKGSYTSPLILIILMAAFLVKFPVYGVHFWLPKAHVEAPVAGSMILAGIMLKLGGYGLLLVYPLISLGLATAAVRRLRLIGGSIIAVLILRVTDIKVIIAYSSVVHMAIIIAVMIGLRTIGVIGGILIILAHGLTSSGIFRGVNIMYERSHTRRILMNKGLLRSNASFTIYWFLLIVINFSGPFTLNLLREIMIIQSLINISYFYWSIVLILCFFSAAYNLVLYASSQQGFSSSHSRVRRGFTSRESLIIVAHSAPILLLLLSLNLRL